MSDLSLETAYTCLTNYGWQTIVTGSGDKTYAVRWQHMPPNHECQYDWTCTCDSYKFGRGKYCKHIATVKASGMRCGWNGELEPTLKPKEDGTCPCCGGETRTERVGV